MHGQQVLSLLLGNPTAANAAALVLAALFAWSGSYKLYRPGRIAAALVNFGLARQPDQRLGRLLGAVEAGVAVALLLAPFRRFAAAAAAVLSIGFFLLLARALRRDHHFSCACLGSNEPITVASLWRAGLMTAAASVVAITPVVPADVAGWMQAGLVAAIVVGVPTLQHTHDRLRRLRQRIDDRLDWNSVLQSVEPDRHLVATTAGRDAS